MSTIIIQQINDVITQYREARNISKYDDCCDLPHEKTAVLFNLMSSTVRQFSPPGSQYEKNLNDMLDKSFATNPYYLPHLAGMLLAAKCQDIVYPTLRVKCVTTSFTLRFPDQVFHSQM